ncbi:hypothetical protein [Streptomyces sp. NPDC056524]
MAKHEPKQPNTAMSALLTESGMTQSQFSTAVNRVGTEQGTPLNTTRPP